MATAKSSATVGKPSSTSSPSSSSGGDEKSMRKRGVGGGNENDVNTKMASKTKPSETTLSADKQSLQKALPSRRKRRALGDIDSNDNNNNGNGAAAKKKNLHLLQHSQTGPPTKTTR